MLRIFLLILSFFYYSLVVLFKVRLAMLHYVMLKFLVLFFFFLTNLTFQTDFSGRVVNNDHFLYWGECARITDDGFEFVFQVVEQTEFIDDASFMPFKGNGMPSQA